jgi:hypothetical protein
VGLATGPAAIGPAKGNIMVTALVPKQRIQPNPAATIARTSLPSSFQPARKFRNSLSLLPVYDRRRGARRSAF